MGSRVLNDAIVPTATYQGALFPYLSANLDFSGDADIGRRFTNTTTQAGLEQASSLNGRIAPSAIIEQGGEKIGLVGATTQLLNSISSPSGTTVIGSSVDNMDLLAAQLQPVIDDLRNQGVNKIILMAHLQNLDNERLLATKLKGVDIILAAGSNTRLGDADDVAVEFPGHAANFADTYPVVIKDADGNNTLLVNTDNEFTYLGRLVVDFDAQGNILLDSLPGQLFKGEIRSVGYGVGDGKSQPAGALPTVDNNRDWLRQAQRFPVKIAFQSDDFPPVEALRVGGQADVLVYTGESGVMHFLGALYIRLMSLFSFLY